MTDKNNKLVINLDYNEDKKEKPIAGNINISSKGLDYSNFSTEGVRALSPSYFSKSLSAMAESLDSLMAAINPADIISKALKTIQENFEQIFEPYYSILAKKYPEDTTETLQELCIGFNNSIIKEYGINKDYWPGYPLKDITPEEQAALPAFTDQTIKKLLDYAAAHIDAIRDSHINQDIVQKQLFDVNDFIKATIPNPYYTYPNSRVYRELPAIQEKSADGKIVPVTVDSQKLTAVEVRLSALDGKDIDNFINCFDRNIMTTVGLLYDAGNREVTAQSIYNAMTIRKSGGRCSKVMKERIEESLDKGVMTRIFIDYSKQSNWAALKAKKGLNGVYIIDTLFIPAKRETKLLIDPKNNKKHVIKKYIIYELPPVYDYSKKIGQLYSLNKKYLNGISDHIVFNESRINIRIALETEIQFRAYDPQKRNKKPITFKEICEITDNIDCLPNETDTQKEKKYKSKKLEAVRKCVFELLDFYTAKGRGCNNKPLIDGYEIVKEGKAITGFRIKINSSLTKEITNNKKTNKLMAKTT